MRWNVRNVWHVWNVANVLYVPNVFERSQRLPRLPSLIFGRRSRQTFLLDLGHNIYMLVYKNAIANKLRTTQKLPIQNVEKFDKMIKHNDNPMNNNF